MSNGVDAVQQEVEHHIEHEERRHGGGRRKSLAESPNKKIALLISVLALFLAFSETLGKKSQTEGITSKRQIPGISSRPRQSVRPRCAPPPRRSWSRPT